MIGAGEPDNLARVYRRHPDVVAAYEAPDGTLALLLRQPLLPLAADRGRWYHDTRRAARAVVADLRAAGVTAEVTILQWRAIEDVTEVLIGWTRRYRGDEVRYRQLTDMVAARLVDRGMAVAPLHAARQPGAAAAELAVPPALLQWYRDMAPCWLGVEPRVRRRLVLTTHEWIVERVLAPIERNERPTVADLAPTGRLVWKLVRVIPAGQLKVWKPWIRLTRADLQRALAWPPARRTERWMRWLFAIPYSIPVTGRRPSGMVSPSVDRHGGVA